ncbi:uncharacterized protein LOC106360905 [Brassica napus]|uniref:uncharacterized protein LOC106360905 n=1 Tax=Brassica napus TaxID=3708 RepID=UPI002078EC59|nr:uncharacterized protein LOC106360905 [Brassica napus]
MKTEQLMLCGVIDPASGTECTVAFVYALNTEAERRSLWRVLVDIATNPLVAASPLLVLGDFNQILLAEEHFSLQPYDLPIREDPILRKLDRVLCSEIWRDRYPEAVSVFEAPGDSDHSPAVVSFSEIPSQRAKEALGALKEIQLQLLTAPSDYMFRQEFVARKNWQFFEAAQEIFFSRKARIRWLDSGDANTKFFFKAVIAHQMRNCISYLMDEGNNRVFNQAQIKEMVVAYFQNLLGDGNLEEISEVELRGLLAYRCPQEISDKLFNTTTISLIPKETGADRLNQFRPISLCSTVYKVMARLLKRKLKLCVSEIVQRNQVGFIQERLLSENVLLATELVKDFNAPGPTTRGCLKIDISKAYDNLSWDFLFKVLSAFDMPGRFIEWIKECVTTPSYSIAINGELQGFFSGNKGLRQGDPISSLLFVIAMDVLSKMLDKGAVDGTFGLHPECESPLITHLSFADDVLVFFDGTADYLRGILSILEEFRLVSGMRINRQKSELLLDGGSESRCRDLAVEMGIAQGALPLRYLGVPLSPKKMTRSDFQPLLDKIAARFSSWTVKHLSFAGRFQLIQAVIYSTISFLASIFIIPSECVSILERMCGAFLWNGAPNSARGAKIAWESVCTPKEVGGLGLKRLVDWNRVLGLKLIWLIFTAGGSLWVSWVRNHLIRNDNFWVLNPTHRESWIRRAICKLRAIARPMVLCEVGTGNTASFWFDHWTSAGPLIDLVGERGPIVTGLSINAVVADALTNEGWRLDRSRSRSPIISLVKACLPNAQEILSSEVEDRFVWYPEIGRGNGSFSASKTWRVLHPSPTQVPWHKAVWFAGRIPKHAFITWIAARNRMVTRDRLIRWGLSVPARCVLCSGFDENRQHLFFDCGYSSHIWSFFVSRLQLTPPQGFEEVLVCLKEPARDANVTLIVRLVHQAVLYLIWKERNMRIHSAVEKPPGTLIAETQQTIRLRLDPLTRRQVVPPGQLSLLAAWRSFFVE